MGFEKLAELRRELAARAEQERREKQTPRKPRRNPRPAATKKDEAVDPVVVAISRLQRLYPKAFPKRPDPKVPLKLGIHKDLHERIETIKLSKEEITEAVKTWCQGSRYWSCLVEETARLDLDGNPSGTVTVAEARFAKQLAARRRAEAIRQRKAEKAQETAPAEGSTPETPADGEDQAAS